MTPFTEWILYCADALQLNPVSRQMVAKPNNVGGGTADD